MDIKSTSYYRYRYMIDDLHCDENDSHNLSFIGCQYQKENGKYDKGFFNLVHGDKSDIRNYIAQHLKNAEDGQAIYEFLQNAEDAKATSFMAFYNDDYFLALNNGGAFTRNGVRSIINVAQSDKKDSSKIGRFGVGFKLVHRLVGEGEGLDELLKDYCGPILFSWSREEDLIKLMESAPVNPVDDVSDDSQLPYLFKILITNFPAGVGETILDIEHKERIGFTLEEYNELSLAVKTNLQQYTGRGLLSSGSLFFIKLGKGKKEKLDNNFETELKVGVEYSLNTLSHIQNVIINGNTINKVDLTIEKGIIEKGTEEFVKINPEYKDSDIKFSVGYKVDFSAEDPFAAAKGLKASPTFYKFFPLGDEIHSSALFIHCDALSNQTNRRKLQDDNTNRTLLPEIAKFIDEKLSSFQSSNNWEAFRELYASILLTDRAHDNSAWLNTCFFDLLPAILKKYIPVITTNGEISYTSLTKNVKVRKIKSNVPLSVVNDELRWFAWGEENKELIKRAREKDRIGLESYDICDLIRDADVTKLNTWIQSASGEDYEAFLNEINEADGTKLETIKLKLWKIKLFKFSDGCYYSRADIVYATTTNNVTKRFYYTNPSIRIFIVSCLHGLEGVLDSLSIIHSNKNISDYSNIERIYPLPGNDNVFNHISTKVAGVALSLEEKKTLINCLSNDLFTGIGKEKISSLKLCNNNKGIRVPLSGLVRTDYTGYTVPEWLKPYQINTDECFKELDIYMLALADIYSSVVLPHWDELKVTERTKVKDFYNEVRALYNLANEKKPLTGLSRFFCEDGNYYKKGPIFSLQSLANRDELQYANLAEGITTVFDKHLPKRDLLPLLKEEPFTAEDKKITDLTPSQESVTADKIEALIKVAISNNESFFSVFAISETDTGYVIKKAQTSCPQAYTDNQDVLSFISLNCKDSFTILPKAFSMYAENSGILIHESFYRQILKAVSSNFSSLKESLIDIIKYDPVKVEYLKKLDSISLDLDKASNDNAFAIKVFKMAVKVMDTEEKRKSFRGMVTFTKDGISTSLTNIPTSASSVFRCNGAKKDFDLAQLLPNEFGNGSLLKEAVTLLQKEGISIPDINTLLGISDSPDQDEIYAKMKANYTAFENTQQLAFAILKEGNGSIDNSGIKAYDKCGKKNTGAFVVANHSFISDAYNLDERYQDLGEFITLPTVNGKIINDYYIDNGSFITQGLNTASEDQNDFSKVIDLLDYLFELRISNKEAFKTVNWNSINGQLRFTPSSSVFPASYASSNEKLPDTIEKWAIQKDDVLAFWGDMGLLTEGMTEMRFRKYMNEESVQYTDTDIYSCQNVKRLEESLRWLASKSVFPVSERKKGCVLNAVEQINKLRKNANRGAIVVTDSFDFDSIKESSVEFESGSYTDWKKETGISIFLFDGLLPKTISLDEYVTGAVVKYVSDTNIADHKDGKIVYINRKSDLKAELHVLAKNNTVGLTNEMVYKLFDVNLTELKAENEELKRRMDLMLFGESTMKADSPNDRDSKSRIDDNEEARKVVMARLQSEGFVFTQGIGRYSNIQGVLDPEGKPVKIVVKSCAWGDIYINPYEWADLLTPHSELWLVSGGDAYPIHIGEMIREQDRINLSIDTVNLDTEKGISKIATLLQWLKAIHFNFKSIAPTHIARDYREYEFDNRTMDEKPSADDFPL